MFNTTLSIGILSWLIISGILVIIILDELESAIFIILEVLKPIVKIIPEPLVSLKNLLLRRVHRTA